MENGKWKTGKWKTVRIGRHFSLSGFPWVRFGRHFSLAGFPFSIFHFPRRPRARRRETVFGFLISACLLAGCWARPPLFPPEPDERHLANLRKITAGGENAEAYWSFDGTRLVMQSTRDDAGCDRIWRIDLGSTPRLSPLSDGAGRTTCSFFLPGDARVLYASTHVGGGPACPPPPDRSQGYVWPLFDSYDIYSAKTDGTDVRPLIVSPGYDAEATVCRDGSIVFTSTRDGDVELYRADADGSNVRRLTHAPGYDGGAFFSPDCSKIVWRASRPDGPELDEFRALLAKGLVRPSRLEIFVADADGSNTRQLTRLGAANFAPSFFPDGKRILFSSNHLDPKGRNFDLFAIGIDGTGLERVTTHGQFDGFPMFSPDGKRLVFASNRGGATPGETNVFIADWVE